MKKENLFYNKNDYELDLDMIKDYINQDMNLFVDLFSINIIESKKNLYGESFPNEKQFLEPIRLNVALEIEDSETTQIGNQMFINESLENISFGVFLDDITDLNIDPKRGDFVLYDDGNDKKFFEINTVTNITTNNTMYGHKPFFKTLTASFVKTSQIPTNLKNYVN